MNYSKETGMEHGLTELRFGQNKNAPKNSVLNHVVDEGMRMSIYQMPKQKNLFGGFSLPHSVIQFLFCAEGSCKLNFGPHYAQQLEENHSMLLYNPQMDLQFSMETSEGCKLLFLWLSVRKLHELFVGQSSEIQFLDEKNVSNKFYTKDSLSPRLRMSLDELFDTELSKVSRNLFLTSKGLEVLSFYFNREENGDLTENCPFLKDQRNVEAIRKCKELLIADLEHTPTIKELSLEVGLNEYQLKLGFKNIYGNTIYNYLKEYRLNHALKLMVTDGLKVQEAAAAIGYTNPSHFISAFRKKFGVTPKKYLMGAS